MAVSDEARLLVRIEANLRQFERAMQSASSTSDRAARRIERRFQTMNRNLATIGAGFARSVIGPLAALASAQEIGQAADAFTRIQNTLRIAGLEGEAAERVFDRLFSAAQRNAAPVESLADLYGRLALAQSELGITAEEMLRFTEGVAAALRVSGASAAESRGALLQLAQAMGSGIIRAEEFNSILEGALPIAQAAARGLEEAGGSVAKLRALIADGKVSSEAFFRAFEAGQGALEDLASTTDVTLGGALTRVRNSFVKLVGTLDDSTGASKGLVTALGGLANVMDDLPGLVDDFQNKLEEMNRSNAFLDFLIVTNQEAGEFKKQIKEMQGAIDEAAASKDDLIAGPSVNDRIAQAFEDASTQRTVSLRDFRVPDDKDKPGRAKKSAAQVFQEDIARLHERTAALRVEAEMVGRSTFEREKALAVLDLENEAKRAGLTLTPQLTAQIHAEAEAYANAAVQLEMLEKAHQELIASMDQVRDTAGGAVSAFVDSLRQGEGAAQALNSALQTVLDTILQIAQQQLIAGLFGAPGAAPGGSLGSLIGSLFGGSTTTMPSASVPRLAAAGVRTAPSQVQVVVSAGEFFDARVARTSGVVAATVVKSNNRKIPGMLANSQARGIAA